MFVRVASGRLEAVTAGEGNEKAPVVFRGPEDAEVFRSTTCKGSTADGFVAVSMGQDAIAEMCITLALS